MQYKSNVPFKSRVVRFFLTANAILVADLLINYIEKVVTDLKSTYDIRLVTLMGMSIALGMFYIVFININKISETFVSIFVKIGRRYLGRWIGFIISLILLFYLIFSGFYWVWFDRNFILESYCQVKYFFSSGL